MSVITALWSGGGGPGAVLVHGGAGRRSDDSDPEPSVGCRAAAAAAHDVLRGGGTALAAVERAVTILEDDPRYNAGVGAALTEDGEVELDASIMDGKLLRAGAVTGLRGFRNAIAVARAILEDGQHVFYAGEGARIFARHAGVPAVEPSSLVTPRALARLEKWRLSGPASSGGTVGAVAMDARGDVAAATSTGGTVGKRRGRVGDSPVLGAGTYAENGAGAASATGHGEGILRVTLTARTVASLRAGAAPEQAASEALTTLRDRVGSLGGLIVVGKGGKLGLAQSTECMPWAAVWGSGAASGD